MTDTSTLRDAVHAWIREDAETAVKLSITPAQVNALVSRLLDAHTAEQPAPDAVEEAHECPLYGPPSDCARKQCHLCQRSKT